MVVDTARTGLAIDTVRVVILSYTVTLIANPTIFLTRQRVGTADVDAGPLLAGRQAKVDHLVTPDVDVAIMGLAVIGGVGTEIVGCVGSSVRYGVSIVESTVVLPGTATGDELIATVIVANQFTAVLNQRFADGQLVAVIAQQDTGLHGILTRNLTRHDALDMTVHSGLGAINLIVHVASLHAS